MTKPKSEISVGLIVGGFCRWKYRYIWASRSIGLTVEVFCKWKFQAEHHIYSFRPIVSRNSREKCNYMFSGFESNLRPCDSHHVVCSKYSNIVHQQFGRI